MASADFVDFETQPFVSKNSQTTTTLLRNEYKHTRFALTFSSIAYSDKYNQACQIHVLLFWEPIT